MNSTPRGSSGDVRRPGAMTTAMRAVMTRPSGPRVLRIGLIHAGTIVEERIVDPRGSVTVGRSEHNDFVVDMPGLPARFKIFERVGDSCVLNFTDGMDGRVGLLGGTWELAQLRADGRALGVGAHHRVKLDDASRGRIGIGPSTLMFQFVDPPPVQPRPQLPASTLSMARRIDWLFTAFATFSFMAMFGFLTYLENADFPIDRGIAEVAPEYAHMIFIDPVLPTPPVTLPEQPTSVPSDGNTQPIQESNDSPDETEGSGPPRPDLDDGPPRVVDAAALADAARNAAQALVIAALSATGGAMRDVLAGGAVVGDAAEILASANGMMNQSASGKDVFRDRTGGLGGSGQGGIGAVEQLKLGQQERDEGTVAERPVGKIHLPDGGGDIAGSGDFDSSIVLRTIRNRIGAIRACYERQLKRNPTLAGKVTVEFTILTTGSVSRVAVKENTTGDEAIGRCVSKTVGRFRFNPGPEGGSVTFAYPFVFARQR